MRRPIEESVYDPSLTKDQKLDLLLRHYHSQGLSGGPVDELMHAVKSEGMTDLQAAKYWAGKGASQEWALYHAEAALRRDPSSLKALELWARELPPERSAERQAAYLAVLERDPKHHQALVTLSSATAWDRPKESMEYATQLVATHPRLGMVYVLMGQAYERLGDPDAAASQYEKGIEMAPRWEVLPRMLDALNSGRSPLTPRAALDPIREPTAEPTPPSQPSGPPPGSAEDGPSRSLDDGVPWRPDVTPEVVQPYHGALEEYHSMVDEFEGSTGRPYQGARDFDAYVKESSNWMAWRYAALWQQYTDAGKPEKAAAIMEAAARRFPDDRLIQDRTRRSR